MITDKLSNFKLFKQLFHLMQRKSHLTIEGLRKIVAIKAAMNRGLSDVIQKAFPDVVRVTRPKVQNKKIYDVY